MLCGAGLMCHVRGYSGRDARRGEAVTIDALDQARLRAAFAGWSFEPDGDAMSARLVEAGSTRHLLIWTGVAAYKAKVVAWPCADDEREGLAGLLTSSVDVVRCMSNLLSAVKLKRAEAMIDRRRPGAHQAEGSRDDGQPLERPAGGAVVALDHHTGQGLEMAAALRELADALEAGRVPYLCVAGWMEGPSGDPDEASAVRITTYDTWQAGLALSGLIQIQSQRLTARLADGEGEG